MKKLSMFMAMVMCATLALSGCGNSVSDDRAEAYASLSSMTSLESDKAQEYRQRLTVAPDSAAIKAVLADAKAANDKEAARKASKDKDRKDTAAAITGVKLVGTTGDCTNVVLVFNADQTWQVSGKDSDKCISHDYKYWSISQYDYDSGEIDLVISDKKKDDINTVGDRRVYPISLGEDNTVGIMLVGNDMYSFTITKWASLKLACGDTNNLVSPRFCFTVF